MNNDTTFHIIEICIQSGLLGAVVVVIWKASAVIQDFKGVKQRQEEHIEDDKRQFDDIQEGLGEVSMGVARIEGRLNGKLFDK